MQNPNRLTSMKINRGNRSFARSRGSSSPKQHYHRHHHPHRRNHHHNGLFITTTLLSCKASSSSVTFVLCCLYLMSCCWLQPIVASSGQKVSTIYNFNLYDSFLIKTSWKDLTLLLYYCRVKWTLSRIWSGTVL